MTMIWLLGVAAYGLIISYLFIKNNRDMSLLREDLHRNYELLDLLARKQAKKEDERDMQLSVLRDAIWEVKNINLKKDVR